MNNQSYDIEFPSFDQQHNEYCDNHNHIMDCKCVEIMSQGIFSDRIVSVVSNVTSMDDISIIDNDFKGLSYSLKSQGYPFNNPVPERVLSKDEIDELINEHHEYLKGEDANYIEKRLHHLRKMYSFSGTEECWKEWIEEYFNKGSLTYPATDYNDDYFLTQEQYCRDLLAEKRINVTEKQIQDYIDYLYELTAYSKPGDKNVL